MSVGQGDAQALDPSTQLASRAANLIEQNPWMDHQTATVLATQNANDAQLQQQASAMQAKLQQGWNGYEQAFYDPVLQAAPSSAYSIASYIHATLGPPPIAGGTINQLQSALAADGFLPNNAVNGVWDTATEAAYNQAMNVYKQQQMAGEHGGRGSGGIASGVSNLLHAVFHDVTHPWDAAVGWYDSATQAAGYFGGWLATGAGTLGTASTQAHISGNITRALGHGETDQQAAAAYSGSIAHRLLEAGSNALALGGLASAGRSAAKGIAEQALKSTAAQAVRDAPGLEAKTAAEHEANLQALTHIGATLSTAQRLGFIGRSINDIGDALRAGTLPADAPELQRNLGRITKTFLRLPAAIAGPAGEQLPNLLSASWKDNLPSLARLAPVAERIAAGADEGGWAYRIRNAMATPYRLAPVRAAGIASQRAQIAALGSHALAAALPGTSFAQNIQHSQVRALDALLDNATINPIPGVSLNATDLLLGPLHGALTGEAKASRVIGDAVSAFTNRLSDALGKTGAGAAIEDSTGLTRQQLLDLAGGDETHLGLWINDHLNTAAQDQYVIHRVGRPLNWADMDERAQIKTLREEWNQLSDEAKRDWVATFNRADTHMQWFRNYLDSSFLRDQLSKEARQAATQTNLSTYLDTVRAGQDLVRSGALAHFISPEGQRLIDDTPPWETQPDVSHLNRQAGIFGLMKTSAKDRFQAQADANTFEQQASEIKDRAEREGMPLGSNGRFDNEYTKLGKEITAYLHQHFNLDASRLQAFANDPALLIPKLREQARDLATPAIKGMDFPQWVQDKLDGIEAKGYKLVVGSHIGHHLDDTLPDLGAVDGWKNPIRHWLGKIGVDPGRVPDGEVSRATWNRIHGRIHQVLVNDPKATLQTLHADSRTVMAVLQHGLDKALPSWVGAAMGLTTGEGRLARMVSAAGLETLNATEAKMRVASGAAKNMVEARGQMENALASQLGLRDVDKRKIVEALMTTKDIAAPSGRFTWQGVDKYTATRIAQAIADGYRLPGRIMGLQAIENWARAGFGFGNFLAQRQGKFGTALYHVTATWPDNYVRLRNQLRFTASPIFGMRRLVKQNYKMWLEGVRPVWNPLQHMADNGELDQATSLWSKISGAKPDTQMDADRYLLDRDVFGLYSPQWHAAHFVNELSKQGKTPAEIKDAYNRVFKYGADGGRTALERTANTVFFPFSFEKNLLRNTGAYLADRPGMSLALDLAVEEWRKADKNGQIGQWVQDHLPLLYELNHLNNAFSSGISPGELGGVNAPSAALLNLFLPQDWGKDFTVKNLRKFMPVIHEFGQLWKATTQQAEIAHNAAHDALGHILNRNWAPEPALTTQAQITYAIRTKAQLVNDPRVKAIIDYNNKQSLDADKYLWPQDPRLPQTMWGKPVDKTTIGLWVQHLYPAYNPSKGAATAIADKTKITAYINHVKQTNPTQAAQLQAFSTAADKVIGHLNNDTYDTPTAAKVQGEFQQYAQQAAERDPVFFKFYSKFYAYALGQLVSPNGKAAA